MRFFRAPSVNGVFDIDYDTMIEGRTISDTEVAVILRRGVDVRQTWTEITENDYLTLCNAANLTVDKIVIAADGIDAATITATPFGNVSEITFINNSTGEIIDTVSVVDGVATLIVKATTPGTIAIVVGNFTILNKNSLEVEAR